MLTPILTPKRRKVRVVLPSRAFALGFLVWITVSRFAPPLHAQEIHIRVLNARNGKPIANECVNVFVDRLRRSIVIPTDKQGVAVLHVGGQPAGAVQAERGRECNGLAAVYPTVGYDDAVEVAGDYYVACQEYGKLVPGEPITDPLTTMPSYPIKKILESGLSAANTCGKFRAEAKPGELIFYVRPRSFFEKMRQ